MHTYEVTTVVIIVVIIIVAIYVEFVRHGDKAAEVVIIAPRSNILYKSLEQLYG